MPFSIRSGLIALAVGFTLTLNISARTLFQEAADYDGDGRADYAVTANENGLKVWHIWRSTAGYLRIQWGWATDFTAAADYDGDGRYDVAVARPGPQAPQGQSMIYYTLNIQTLAQDFKVVFATPAAFLGAQDYDGDGKADPAVSQTGGQTGIFYRSTVTGAMAGHNLPTTGTAVRIGTLDADDRADLTVYHTSPNPPAQLWYASPPNPFPRFIDFGMEGDQLVAGDLDDDGRGEIIVFRPASGDWYWRYGSDGSYGHMQWGQLGDIPVPADYDGDGRTDIAVYRRGTPNSIYYINGSTAGPFTFVWGTTAHTPVGY